MKAHYRKRKTRYEFELTGNGRTTAHGGQILVDCLCRRLHLWERLGRIEGIDPRKRKGSGHDPEAMAAQILFTLTSGGITLADAERIGPDAVLLESVGLEKVADQTTLSETYAWVMHMPAGMNEAQRFAACRWKRPEELFWRYAFVACEKDATRTPRAVFERHRLKGACEQRFSEVLSDLDRQPSPLPVFDREPGVLCARDSGLEHPDRAEGP